jgi:hypothetical protein
MNNDGYIVLDIVVSMVPINVVLLVLEHNSCPVERVECMEPLTPRTIRSTCVLMRKLVMSTRIPGVTLISLTTWCLSFEAILHYYNY